MAKKKVTQRSRSLKDAAIVIGLLLFIFGVWWADPRSHNNPEFWRQAGIRILAVLIGVPLLMAALVVGLIGVINLGRMSRRMRHPPQEARAWLTQSGPERNFGGNRFEDLAQAKEFVDRLYRMGALKVEVDNIRSQAKTETRIVDGKAEVIAVAGSRFYADTLRVTLPELPAQRKEILKLYNREAQEESGEKDSSQRDRGQKFLEFWWD